MTTVLETIQTLREALAAWVKVAQMAPTDSMEEWIRAHGDAMNLTERAGFPWPPEVWDHDDTEATS